MEKEIQDLDLPEIVPQDDIPAIILKLNKDIA